MDTTLANAAHEYAELENTIRSLRRRIAREQEDLDERNAELAACEAKCRESRDRLLAVVETER
jgi:chromosome segregation ATPase